MQRALVPTLALALACGGGELVVGDVDDSDGSDDPPSEDTEVPVDTEVPDDTEPPEDTEPPVDPRYDDAVLVVEAPRAGSIHLLADGIPLLGWVEAADGDRMPFEDLEWQVRSTAFVGLEHVFLGSPGVYEVDVLARLPNGDRLTASVGGVRLQSPLTGVWAGSVTLTGTGEYQGQPLQTSCIGPFDFQVNMAGRLIAGSGGCTLPLIITSPIDLTFSVDGEVTGTDVSGSLGVGLSVLPIPIPWSGTFTSPTRLEGGFDADLWLLQVDATLSARKLSPLLPP